MGRSVRFPISVTDSEKGEMTLFRRVRTFHTLSFHLILRLICIFIKMKNGLSEGFQGSLKGCSRSPGAKLAYFHLIDLEKVRCS